jgi:hypothetical protein
VLHATDLDRPFLTYNAESLEMLSPQLERALEERRVQSSISEQVKWILKRLHRWARDLLRTFHFSFCRCLALWDLILGFSVEKRRDADLLCVVSHRPHSLPTSRRAGANRCRFGNGATFWRTFLRWTTDVSGISLSDRGRDRDATLREACPRSITSHPHNSKLS